MNTPQFPAPKLPPASEYALILGSGASAVLSLATQQAVAASLPITTLVAIGLLNRHRLDQRLKHSEAPGPTASEATARQGASATPQVTSQPVPEAMAAPPQGMKAQLSPARFSQAAARLAETQSAPKDRRQAFQKDRLQQIGACLQAARQAKSLSLADIYQQTRIQMYTLRALEAGDLRSLPEPFYIRAFIMKYANALSLNGSELVAEFPLE